MPDYDPRTGLSFTVDDLSMRLTDSLVRYRGDPTYLSSVDGRTFSATNTRHQTPVNFRLPDAHLDIRPVPLGYVNGNSKCWYITRSPERRYKQGLSSSNIRVNGPNMRMHKRDFLISRGMAKCILNEYPSYENALRAVRRSEGGKAFNRRFCLQWDKELGEAHLCHRGIKVGTVVKGQPVLSERHSYLNEELQGAMQ